LHSESRHDNISMTTTAFGCLLVVVAEHNNDILESEGPSGTRGGIRRSPSQTRKQQRQQPDAFSAHGPDGKWNVVFGTMRDDPANSWRDEIRLPYYKFLRCNRCFNLQSASAADGATHSQNQFLVYSFNSIAFNYP
jgi:hypothetical protein